jgi:hypothetical protein
MRARCSSCALERRREFIQANALEVANLDV